MTASLKTHSQPCFFALKGTRTLGSAIARELDLLVARHEEIEFEDGEHKIRPTESVRGRDVLVVHSLFGEPGFSVNDKLCRLLFFVGALKDAGAQSVTAVIPYLCYSRKDRRCVEYDPVCTRYFAQLLEAVGVTAVLTLDVHNQSAFENAFRIPNQNLESQALMVKHFAPELRGRPLAVISPDSGGVKRAEAFRIALQDELGQEISKGFVEKIRDNEKVTGDTLVGDVKGRTVLLFDDLIASGTTLVKAARMCKKGGAREVYAGATHGVFTDQANTLLADPALDRIVITDSVRPFRIVSQAVMEKLQVLSTAEIWSRALAPKTLERVT